MKKNTYKFEYYFSTEAQRRGNDFHDYNRITSTFCNESMVTAQFNEPGFDTVEIQWSPPILICSCSCDAPTYCDHIWATLKKVDQEDLLSAAHVAIELRYEVVDGDIHDEFKRHKITACLKGSPLNYARELMQQMNLHKEKQLKLLSVMEDEKELKSFNNYSYYISSGEHLLSILERHESSFPDGLLVSNREKFWDETGLEKRGYKLGFEKNYNPDMERSLTILAQKSINKTLLDTFTAEQEIIYQLDLNDSSFDELNLFVYSRRKKINGEWGALKNDRNLIKQSNDPLDQKIFTVIGGKLNYSYSYALEVMPSDMKLLAPVLAQSGRCWLVPNKNETVLKTAKVPPNVDFAIKVKQIHEDKFILYPILSKQGKEWLLTAKLKFFSTHGYIHKHTWYDLDLSHFMIHLKMFDACPELELNSEQLKTFLSRLMTISPLPQLFLPNDCALTVYSPEFTKMATFEEAQKKYQNKRQSLVNFAFNYETYSFDMNDKRTGVATEKGFLRRNSEAEKLAIEDIKQCNVRHSNHSLMITNEDFFKNMDSLSANHWQIRFKGKKIRANSALSISVNSGIDWLEVNGKVTFGKESLSLIELLSQVKDNQEFITLSDGSLGYLEKSELQRIQKLLQLGKKDKESFKFHNSQAFLIDALLEEHEDVTFDPSFKQAQKRLQEFSGIGKENAPRSFKGTLRPYQKEGLAWLNFTREFGVGACLADDMGLGKTIQVIALLEQRRLLKINKPTLIVVPTSLIFNWLSELDKFAPKIQVLNHTGTKRTTDNKTFSKYDIVLTTYGLMRNNITILKETLWDYAILDEGQAIKNAKTSSAKASRLLQADHRLIMSGTPIENHLGELWSLFEFLNPGMLGAARAFANFSVDTKDTSTLQAFSKALRPMILRRKKENVLTDLPDKTEQTLFCKMSVSQTKFYNDLRDTYRREILGQGDEQLEKNKFRVLEALTRLRQAACHPRLIQKDLNNESCKLDMVIPQILEVMEQGHKVLVFSQFTSFLALLRERLDADKVNYEYLDGRTRKREEKVRNFQENDQCQLFLISLKAGGTGLNLTKAEYVYILDPWWNPATEAQAIDRAHRIGQTNKVFAYRVIAKGTIEEKILELQKSKKALADSILADDQPGLRNLSREDLETLFS